MRIDILSVVPEMIESPFQYSIMKRAQEKGLAEVYLHDLRKYSTNNYGSIDDYQYGGGAGMVMQCEPLDNAITELKSQRTYDAIIYMTPDGKTLNQKMCNQFSLGKNLMILCGHYKGIDQRIREMHITHEISIGDYVLSGGELAAAVFCDAVIRLIPGVIGDETSALSDSFQDHLLSPEVYTRPAEYKGMKVPEVLLSGDFKKIDQWREQNALERTEKLRPDLLGEE